MVLLHLLIIHILILLELPLNGSQNLELLLQLGLLHDHIEDPLRELLDQDLVESQLLRVVVLVKLQDELCIEIEEDIDPINEPLQYLQSTLGLDDGRFPQSLLQIVYYFYISFLGLLECLALPRFHSCNSSLRYIYKPDGKTIDLIIF